MQESVYKILLFDRELLFAALLFSAKTTQSMVTAANSVFEKLLNDINSKHVFCNKQFSKFPYYSSISITSQTRKTL